MKEFKMKYEKWTLVDWDGNPEQNYQCLRKSFRRGHVSIGIGEFKSIVYSYGPNHEDSMSSTRSRISQNMPDLTMDQAMNLVDSNNGKYHAN